MCKCGDHRKNSYQSSDRMYSSIVKQETVSASIKKYLQGLLINTAFGMWFWNSSIMYYGNEHLGRAFEGPKKQQYFIIYACYICIWRIWKVIVLPISGMKRNLLCSFKRWWSAIIFPSLPKFDLQGKSCPLSHCFC